MMDGLESNIVTATGRRPVMDNLHNGYLVMDNNLRSGWLDWRWMA